MDHSRLEVLLPARVDWDYLRQTVENPIVKKNNNISDKQSGNDNISLRSILLEQSAKLHTSCKRNREIQGSEIAKENLSKIPLRPGYLDGYARTQGTKDTGQDLVKLLILR